MSDTDRDALRLKAEEWDLSVGALVEDSGAEIDVIAAFEDPADGLDGNSEDSTCESEGAREGGEIAPSNGDPVALSPKDDESDSELPDIGSLPELQAKGTARSRAGRRRTSK